MAFSNPISNLFGKSPIKPLQEHMSLAVSCASQLEPFFDAVITNKWSKASKVFDQIVESENHADELKKQFRLNMPKSLFMPVSRTDLLNILAQQDEIANMAKFAAAEASLEALDQAIQTHGGNGMAIEYGLADLWFIARLHKTAPVSREMILNFVAQHSLGLPKSY